MRVLVTGAAGFIGSNLVDRLLSNGHSVIGLDNLQTGSLRNLEHALMSNSFNFENVDIRDLDELKSISKNIEAILHLGALADIVPSIDYPEDYFSVNVVGTFNVMQVARYVKAKRFIYIASSSCYGVPKTFPTPESANIDPRYPYALTKYLGERIAMHWGEVYEIPTISLRLFNVFGPRARTSGSYGAVFGVFLAQKLAGLPFTVVGDGTQTRDFTYVSDVVDAIVTAMESRSNGIYNVGSGNTYSINKLIELLSGKAVYIPKRPGEPDCTYADISKITKELGWSPKVSFEDGVQLMLKHIKDWSGAPIWSQDSIAKATENWFRYIKD
jgi:UDP-glucose 4-epimerase